MNDPESIIVTWRSLEAASKVLARKRNELGLFRWLCSAAQVKTLGYLNRVFTSRGKVTNLARVKSRGSGRRAMPLVLKVSLNIDCVKGRTLLRKKNPKKYKQVSWRGFRKITKLFRILILWYFMSETFRVSVAIWQPTDHPICSMVWCLKEPAQRECVPLVLSAGKETQSDFNWNESERNSPRLVNAP